jgi:hypothetical protein
MVEGKGAEALMRDPPGEWASARLKERRRKKADQIGKPSTVSK